MRNPDYLCFDCVPPGSGKKLCTCRECVRRHGRHPKGGVNCPSCGGSGRVTIECEASNRPEVEP